MHQQMLLGTGGGVVVDIASLFDATTYAGNGDTTAINNGLNLSGTGGLVWIKNRDLDNNRNIDRYRKRNICAY